MEPEALLTEVHSFLNMTTIWGEEEEENFEDVVVVVVVVFLDFFYFLYF